MPSPNEATSYTSSSSTNATPSKLDPRFAVNESLQITQNGAVCAFGFSYLDGANGRQVTEWVFLPTYVLPPAEDATMEAPTSSDHEFTTIAEWEAALKLTGTGAIWQPGSTFSRSWVTTYRGVPSPDVSYYAAAEEWPTVPVAPPTGDAVDQVDPGRVHALVGPVEASLTGSSSMVANVKTDICVATAAVAGHPERGDTRTYTAEFWTLFGQYAQPTSQALPIDSGPAPGVTAVTLPAFLAYWNSGTAIDVPTSLCVVTCSRSRVNPYVD